MYRNRYNSSSYNYAEANAEKSRQAKTDKLSKKAIESAEEQIAKEKKVSVDDEVNYFKRGCIDTKRAFQNYLANNNGNISKEEFEKWEDDYSFNYQHMQSLALRAGYPANATSYFDHIEGNTTLPFSDLPPNKEEKDSYTDNTIEAVAGKFYSERMNNLVQAIKSNGSEESIQDYESLGNFWSLVSDHLFYKSQQYVQFDSDYQARRYDERRTDAHNAIIDKLNQMNDLCRKYGVRPFTMRNFVTTRRKIKTASGGLERRQRFDRDIVESYYAHAFGGAVDQEVAKIKYRSLHT